MTHPTPLKHLQLSGKALAILANVTKPASPRNPWGTRHTKARNRLLVRLCLETGLRAAQLAKAEYFSGALRVKFVKHRPEAPTMKENRIVLLSSALLEAVKDYRNLRNSFPEASKHPYLFVDEPHGRPISPELIASIFKTLQSVDPALANVTPTSIRATCALIAMKSEGIPIAIF